MISSRTRGDVSVFIIKFMKLFTRVIVLRLFIGPPGHVVGIHDELEKVRAVPGVSQAVHHIYIKIGAPIEVSKVRRDVGVWTRGDHNRPIRVIDVSHIVGGD